MSRTRKRASVGERCKGGFAGVLAVAALVVGAGGCGDAGGTKLPPAGTGGLGGAGTSPEPTVTAIWNDASQSIDLTCASYFMGSMRFAAARAQLSVDQLALLAKLRVVDSSSTCTADGFSCSVSVFQGDGTTLTIGSAEGDTTCQQIEKVVSYATLAPFVDTLTCHYAKGAAVSSPDDDVVAPDVRCYNGLFTSGSGDLSRQIPLADVSSPLHIELDDCDQPGRIGKFSFTLLDADGTTLGTSVAPSDPGPEHTCAALTAMVPHPETASVVVSVDGAMLAGDFWLHVYQAPPPAGVPVWNDGSQSVDVSCSGYYAGSMRFVASRAELTVDQLALLSNIRTAGESASCSTDGMECDLTIVQADGSSQTWTAPEDGWCLQPRNDLISFTTFHPFLGTLSCAGIRAGTQPVNVISADPRCFDQLFTNAQPIALPVSVGDASKPLHVELDDCDQPEWAGSLSFTVLDTDETTVLGTSTAPVDAGPYHACATLTTVVPHPGSVTVTVSANATPAAGFSLRVYQ